MEKGSGNKVDYEKMIVEVEIKAREVKEKYHYKPNKWSDKGIREMASDVNRLG
jgi:hypothetical protein